MMKKIGYATKAESFALVNLKNRELQVLSLLDQNPHGLSRSQIAQLLGVQVHRITAAVHKLIKKGFAEECGTLYDADSDRNVARVVAKSGQ